VKPTAVIEERRCVRIASASDHLAHEAAVVAHRHDLTYAAIEPGGGLGQDRRLDLALENIDAREPGPTTRASRVRESPRQPMIGPVEQIDGETAAPRETVVHATSARKEDRQEWWVERRNDAGAGRCRMWLPINHRDHDGDAARNLTRGTAEGLPRVRLRLSH
jgi:hypothetical protein